MFRARVAAQGFTVIAMVAGSMYYSQDRQKTKELRKLKDERDAEEKRQKWIRELEVRDEEEKSMRAALEQRRVVKTQTESDAVPEPPNEQETGTGGILGKMGLWSKGQEKAEAEAAELGEVEGRQSRKENPKSSLGAIGEALASQKKEDDKSRK